MKVAFIGHSPATANSLYPLIKPLQDNGVDLKLYAYHDYVSRCWGVEKQTYLGVYPTELKSVDLILYGTGSSNPIELCVPSFSKEQGIPCIAIHDIFWSETENFLERYLIPPTSIIVPTEQLKEDVYSLNRALYEILIPLGNPHFDRLSGFRGTYKVEPPYSVAFFSQCSTVGDYSTTHDYSKLALETLLQFNEDYPKLISRIYVTPHPREHGDWLKSKIQSIGNVEYIEHGGTPLMLKSDVIYGYSCTLQYEAEMIGKPVVFYKGKESTYADFLNVENGVKRSYGIEFNATEKCVEYIMSCLK